MRAHRGFAFGYVSPCGGAKPRNNGYFPLFQLLPTAVPGGEASSLRPRRGSAVGEGKASSTTTYYLLPLRGQQLEVAFSAALSLQGALNVTPLGHVALARVRSTNVAEGEGEPLLLLHAPCFS
jgi:hypothetical protein